MRSTEPFSFYYWAIRSDDRQFEITLTYYSGRTVVWCMCPGDALGIYPENCGEDVTEILQLTGWDDSQRVDVPAHAYQPVTGQWLISPTSLLLARLWANIYFALCRLSSSVTLRSAPAGSFTCAGLVMTSCHLQSDYSFAVTQHCGPVVLHPVKATPFLTAFFTFTSVSRFLPRLNFLQLFWNRNWLSWSISCEPQAWWGHTVLSWVLWGFYPGSASSTHRAPYGLRRCSATWFVCWFWPC